MCCSVSPKVSVHFSDTVVYAAEVLNPKSELVHVLGYQNRVQGRVGALPLLASWLPLSHTGNAMILPFPADPKSMTEANILDTKNCRNILQDMADAVAPRRKMRANRSARTWGLARKPPPIQVFASGIYTVVLAQDPRDIPSALEQVPRSKRPALNPALFDTYAHWYPNWTIALCCFNNRRARLATPMLWWYKPMYPDRLFVPALDCHTGDIPDLRANVDVDHVIAVGSHRMTGGEHVHFRDNVPESVARYLRPTIIGKRFAGSIPNGDFVCRLAEVWRGKFLAARTKPEAA